MPNYTETQMRQAIEGEVIAATTVAAVQLAIVFPWWALGGDENQWPAKLISPNDGNKVHGYVITRKRTFGKRINPGCVRRFFTFQIRGLRWYDETGTRTANSDFAYNAELDAIAARFNTKSNLPDSIRRIAEDSELDFSVDLNLYGGQLLHRSVGEITIEQC